MNSNACNIKSLFSVYFFRQNKDRFMLPYIIFAWIGIFFLFVALIYIPADWFGDGIYKETFIALINPKNKAEKKEVIHVLGIYYSVACIVIFLILGKFCTNKSLTCIAKNWAATLEFIMIRLHSFFSNRDVFQYSDAFSLQNHSDRTTPTYAKLPAKL